MKKRFILLSILPILLFNSAYAQPGWTFYKNAVIPVTGISYCIQTDYQNGTVFLGLMGGLVKYNGSEWLKIYYNELDPSQHSNEYNVRELIPQGAIMWAGTNEGIIAFNGYNKKVYNKQNTKNMADDHIRGLTPDIDGNIWYLSQSSFISKLDVAADSVINYEVSHDIPTPWWSGDAKMFTDNERRLWYSLDGKLVRFKDSVVKVIDTTDIPAFKDNEVRWIQIQFDYSLAVLFKRGIGIYKEVDGVPTFKEIAVPDSLLPEDEFFDVFKIDMEGNIWILARVDAGDGIASRHFYKLTKQGEWTKYDIPIIAETITQTYAFTDFTVDLAGQIWFSEPYEGVFVFDPKKASANDKHSNQIEIYPNPANDLINVDNFGSMFIRYAIIDLLGREVCSGELSGGRIDISGLIPGEYFLRIGSDAKPFVKSN